jgi:hypothetical protein
MKHGAVFIFGTLIQRDTTSVGRLKMLAGQFGNVNLGKVTLVMGRQDYHWKHEPCLYGWKDGAGHLWSSDRKQTTILRFDKPRKNGEHPTMKPVELWSIKC